MDAVIENILFIRKKLPQSAILMQLAEEYCEAAKAALKLARIEQGINPTPVTREEALNDLNEEMADVDACLCCLGGMNYSVQNKVRNEKIERWANRLAAVSEK